MGLFDTLMKTIFGHAPASTQPTSGASQTGASGAGQSGAVAASGAQPASATAGAATQAAPAPAQQVDVAAILNGLAAKNPEKLDWKRSIVDLMKLVGMESSLSSRKELATDLGYTGDQNDSASMNMWLHKEVMKKLAENGGKVPADLLNK